MRRVLLVLLGCLWLARPASGAVAFVQAVTNANASTVLSYNTTVSATGSGNLLIAFVYTSGGATEHVSTVSDGTTNFSHIGEQSGTQSGSTVEYDCYYLPSSTSGKTTITVTYTLSNGAFKFIGFLEISGFTTPAVDTSNQLIGTAGGSGTFDITGAAVTSSTATGIQAAFTCPDNAIVQNPKSGNEFSSGGDSAGGAGCGVVSLIPASAASHTPIWTSDTSGQAFSEMTAAFKETAVAGTAKKLLLLGVGDARR